MHGMGTLDSELNLIKAADKSSVTKRYIPNIWGARMTDEWVSLLYHGRVLLKADRTTT
jgi:hypothetical protein